MFILQNALLTSSIVAVVCAYNSLTLGRVERFIMNTFVSVRYRDSCVMFYTRFQYIMFDTINNAFFTPIRRIIIITTRRRLMSNAFAVELDIFSSYNTSLHRRLSWYLCILFTVLRHHKYDTCT